MLRFGRTGVPVIFAEWPFSPYYKYSTLLEQDIHYVQQPAITSALHRAKSFARWIGFLDLDEFIYIPARSLENIPSILESYGNSIVGVFFRNSWAVIDCHEDDPASANPFDILDLKEKTLIFDQSMHPTFRTKYFVRTARTETAFIHKWSITADRDGKAANDGTTFFLHFSLENHADRSRAMIASPGLIVNFEIQTDQGVPKAPAFVATKGDENWRVVAEQTSSDVAAKQTSSNVATDVSLPPPKDSGMDKSKIKFAELQANGTGGDIGFEYSAFNFSVSRVDLLRVRASCQDSVKAKLVRVFSVLTTDLSTPKVAYFGPTTHDNLGDCILSLCSLLLLEV